MSDIQALREFLNSKLVPYEFVSTREGWNLYYPSYNNRKYIVHYLAKNHEFNLVKFSNYNEYNVSLDHVKLVLITDYLSSGTSTATIKTLQIKKVIFNKPATIALWEDGTKTVVKCGKDDIFDEEKGLAMAISKKAFGNTGNFNEIFKKWIPKTNATPKVSRTWEREYVENYAREKRCYQCALHENGCKGYCIGHSYPEILYSDEECNIFLKRILESRTGEGRPAKIDAVKPLPEPTLDEMSKAMERYCKGRSCCVCGLEGLPSTKHTCYTDTTDYPEDVKANYNYLKERGLV